MIQIDLPYLLPGLNGREGLMRMHWTKRRALAKTVQWDIISQVRSLGVKSCLEVRVTYTAYRHRLMDWDNFASSFKLIGDALKAAGVIKDDSPKFVRDFVLRQEAIKRVEKARTVVQVESYVSPHIILIQQWEENPEFKTGWSTWGWEYENGNLFDEVGYELEEVLESDKYGHITKARFKYVG